MARQPVHDRPVPVEHRGPVDAVQVRAPVVVAHDPPVLLEHLVPLGDRVELEAQPLEVDLDEVGVVGLDGAVGGADGHVVPAAHHDPLAVTADRDAVRPLDQLDELALDEGEELDDVPRRLALHPGPAGTERRRLPGLADPQHAVPRRLQVAVAARRDGEGHQPLLEVRDVDEHGGCRGRVGGRGRGGVRLLADPPAVRARPEGGRLGGPQRDEVGPDGAAEPQVEDVAVVAGVEGAGRQEGQVAAVGAERGRGVVEAPAGQRDGRGAGRVEVGQHQPALLLHPDGLGPGQPAAVRGEREPPRLAVGGEADVADVAGREVDQPDRAVVGQGGHLGAGGVALQVQHPAELAGGQHPRLALPARAVHVQRVLAVAVADQHGRARAAERPDQPGAHPRVGRERAGRALAVAEQERLAAPLHEAGVPAGVGSQLGELLGRPQLPGSAAGQAAGQRDLQRHRGGADLVEPVERAERVVDHPLAVGGGVADVALRRGVPGQELRSCGPVLDVEAVEVGDLVGVVGEGGGQVAGEHQPVTDPHRVHERGLDVGEQPLPAAVLTGAVQPELRSGAAAVALPERGRSAAHAGEHGRAVTPQGHAPGGTERQPFDAEVQTDGVHHLAPQVGLVRRGGDQDPAVGGPAQDRGRRAPPPGQPPGGPALDVHRVGLAVPVAGGGPGHGPAVRGEPRVLDRRAVVGQPPGAAAVDRREPHVVGGHEGDQVGTDVGVAQVGHVSAQ